MDEKNNSSAVVTAPVLAGQALASALRDRTTLRYMGNCKCGKCQLVPHEMVGRAADEIDRLAITNAALLSALKGLLNDCINFDDGNLTVAFMRDATAAITAAETGA